jgi:hypothetical protein
MEKKPHSGINPESHRLARSIDQTGWAFLLIMTGALWLVPSGWLPEGTWLLGTGLILLASSAARHLHRLRTSTFGFIVGLAVLLAGVEKIIDREILSAPILVIVVGVAMVGKVVVETTRRSNTISVQ